MKISEMVAAQNLNNEFERFIEEWGVDNTHKEWGFFDTNGRTNLLLVDLCGDIIVAIKQDSRHELYAGGVGHHAVIYAVTTDLKRRWEPQTVLYIDQWDSRKDRIHPIPEKIEGIEEKDQLLVVKARLPNGSEKMYHLRRIE